jgi:CheY-like chemotaxis protein
MKKSLILIAEDNADDADILTRAFRSAGLRNPIRVVSDGGEAIRYLKGEGTFSDRANFPPPRLLFIDLKMPGVGGFDLLRWLREHPELRIIPAIVLTSSSLEEDVKLAYDLGANCYLSKPIAFDDLKQMIQVTLQFWTLCSKPEVKAAA